MCDLPGGVLSVLAGGVPGRYEPCAGLSAKKMHWDNRRSRANRSPTARWTCCAWSETDVSAEVVRTRWMSFSDSSS